MDVIRLPKLRCGDYLGFVYPSRSDVIMSPYSREPSPAAVTGGATTEEGPERRAAAGSEGGRRDLRKLTAAVS